jgi:hypothetical protein
MDNPNNGELKVFNPDKQISEQITLKNLVMHDVAMKLARTGIPELPSEKPLTFNERIQLRFKGINEVIASQQCLIVNARAIVRFNNYHNWEKQYKTAEEQLANPFNDEDNDYNELMAILSFLNECEQRIIKARKTKKFEDDFIWEKEDHEGEIIFELTPNFFEMLKELEDAYESIYNIMQKNKIVSSGASFDEELTEKELEEEVLRRIVDS